MQTRLKSSLASLKSKRIMVIGDLILDEYIWGNIDRISPEAPVGILESRSENAALGGAANVANNLKALGCKVEILGVVGADEKGKKLKRILREKRIGYSGVIEDHDRPTTNKIRVIAHNQQILRVDRESRKEIRISIRKKLLNSILDLLINVDGIICSDYGKGIITANLIKELVSAASKLNKKIIADPKGLDYTKYRGISILTPNKKEASESAGIKIESESDLTKTADKLFDQFGGEGLLITRGDEGISLFRKDTPSIHVSTVAKEVYDVTGAGDTVISVFGMAYFNGVNIVDAVRLANIAAGIEVGKVGTSVVTRNEISNYIENNDTGERKKILDLAELAQVISRAKNKGEKIVFTNGCFDLLHIGHIKYLSRARSLGNILIIGLNRDKSIRELKGPKRPLIGEIERASLLAALDCVDYVVLFSEMTPEKLIKTLKPDVLVKGGDYSVDEVVGKSIVEGYGGRVELVPIVKGMSTSGIVKKIIEKYRE